MAATFSKGFRTLAALTMLSRVLGMVRDATLAFVFGTSLAMNAFSVAFNLPNLFRRLFGEGALSVAFIPVFTGLLEQKDEAGARRLANLTVTLLVAVLAVVVLLGEGIILLIAALADASPRLALTLGLAAVMLPFLVTICLVALLQAILNVRGHFLSPALAPIVLNVCIVGGALLAAPLWGTDSTRQIYGVALSVLAAGVLQVVVQIPVLRRHGFRFRPVWDTASPHVRQIARLMLPMVIGLGIVQINTFVDQIIAMALSPYEGGPATFSLFGRDIAYPISNTGAVSIMYFSQRFYQLPFGVFTIALGTAIFPVLARHAHHGDHRGLASTLNRGLRVATFIALPCTVGMLIVAQPLVRAVLQQGRFTAEDTPAVTLMTMVYVSGLVSYSVLHLVTRSFFALQEPLTPVKTAMAAAVVNFVLNLTLVWVLGLSGLAVATVLAATGQAALLLWLLRRRLGRLGTRAYLKSFWRCCVATVLMGVAAWGAVQAAGLTGLAPESRSHAVASLLAAASAGGLVYAAAARLLRMQELSDVLRRSSSQTSNAP